MSAPEPTEMSEHGELPEGEEAPPRGVQVMAWLRWLLVLAMAVLAALSLAQHYGLTASSSGAQAALYTCPMHPSVVRDQPGQCPICDMSLVPVEEARSQPAAHTHAADGEGAFYCPMHPEVSSDDPSATCAKCGGMKLLPRPAKNQVAELTLDAARVQRMGVQSAPVVRGAQAGTLTVWGVVSESDARVSRVHARAAGYVEQLFARERATQVKAGQPLLSLFSPELVAAQRELLTSERFRARAGEGTMAAPDLTTAAREKLRTLGVSDAEIDAILREGQARHALTIRAPQAGNVSEKAVVQGSYVEAGALLMEITDLSEVWLLANVPESALAGLTLGATAEVRVSGEQAARKGELSFIYPEIDVAQRTAQVRIRLPNRELTLRPGMSAQVTLPLPAREGLFIPHTAVLDAGERKFVFVQHEDGRFSQLSVELGARAGELIEVLAGLKEGERVVTSSAFLLDSETRLRSVAEPAPSVPAEPGGER
jgi:Cu(I)/Ag(I) efflux system membrane fusion protein